MKKCRSFYKFFLSYIFILIIPVIIGVYAYHKMIRIVELEEKKSNLALLDKIQYTLDNDLLEIEWMALRLGNDPYIRKLALLDDPYRGNNIYYLHQLQRRLSAYSTRNCFLHSFYIYFRNSDRILTKDGFYKKDFFYENYFNYDKKSLEEFQNLFFEPSHYMDYIPTAQVTIGPVSSNMLTYIQSFPSVFDKNPTIVIWIFIDEKEVQNLFRNVSTDGNVYIINKNEQVVVSSLNTGSENNFKPDTSCFIADQGFTNEIIKKQKNIISYTTSFYKEWKYVAVTPYSVVLAKTRFIRWLMIGLGIIILFFGFVTAYLLALRNVKPLMDLVAVVNKNLPSKNSYNKNEYDYIKSNVKEITEMNKYLQNEMSQQLPLFRASFFRRLFKGEYFSENEIKSALSRLSIDIKGNFFSVLILRINIHDNSINNDGLGNLFKAKAIIKRIILKKSSGHVKIHDRDVDDIVLLMCFTEFEADNYRNIADELFNEIFNILDKDYNINIYCAGGKIYPRLRDVWHSYRECIEASETMRISNNFIITWYDEHSESKDIYYYYPLNLEEQLLNSVKTGNKEELRNILSLVYRENIENRSLSSDMLRLLVNDLCCSIIKIISKINLKSVESIEIINTKIRDVQRCEIFYDAYKTIENVFELICNTIEHLKKSHNEDLITNIKKYIQSNYTNSFLNRYTIAKHFAMTEEYLSSFFKEHTGKYFSDFVEETRMQNARQLLLENNTTINEIAGKTGFNSQIAFGRAFKRVNGLTPRDYRKSVWKSIESNVQVI